jgi:DNA modification methylase
MSRSRTRRVHRWRVEHADCLKALAELRAGSVEAVVTDPPYGISFNGMAWDRPRGRPTRRRTKSGGAARADCCGPRARSDGSTRDALDFQETCRRWASECLRVLKPGGHLAAFGSPRTSHRLACAIEEAGFELRDTLMWLHAQGFPKSRSLGPGSEGWGTTLKPAYEPIVLARRPLQGTTAENRASHGTGALHIAACRAARSDGAYRWPANILLSHGSRCRQGECAGDCPVGALGDRNRFFFCAKPNRRERDVGCERLPRRTTQAFKIGALGERRACAHPVANIHPTVKPVELMRWIVRLVAPPGALVLDPFAGSGSTGVAAVLEDRGFVGIEREADYVRIARARIAYHARRHQSERGRGGA